MLGGTNYTKLGVLVSLLLVLPLFTAILPRAYADPVDVTVIISRVIENTCPEEFLTVCPGDYYSTVQIAGQEFESGTVDGGCGFGCGLIYTVPYTISPFWTFTKTVDSSVGTVPIVLHIREEDPLLNPNDIMDINPQPGKNGLELQFDLSTGTWTGDVPANVGFSSGPTDGSHDGDGSAKIFFSISIGNGDIDGDHIPDGVERFGILDSNGNPIGNTNGFGFPMDPCRKTIAIEVDYMNGAADGHDHQPKAAALNQAVAMFNNAPPSDTPAVSPCPYPGFPMQASGVNLVVDVDDPIAEAATTSASDFTTLKRSNFTPERGPYFHYSIFGHAQPAPNTGSSGVTQGRNDFLVSLGGWNMPSTPPPAGCTATSCDFDGDGLNDVNVGTLLQQTGTFVHELGHTLGLGHGGADAINCKPNYLSAMNYPHQFGTLYQTTTPGGVTTTNTQIDYSRLALPVTSPADPTLSEPSLDENLGVGATGAGTIYQNAIIIWDTDGNSPINTIVANANNGPIDWNVNGNIDSNNVSTDLNNFLNTRTDDCPPFSGTSRTASQLNANEDLAGYNDWANLSYGVSFGSGSGGPPAEPDHHPDMNFQQYQQFQQEVQQALSTDLKVTKTVDKADAIPGDILAYTVAIENVGNGQATAIQLVDTYPDGTAETRNLADIKPNQQATENFSYKVPFPIADLTVLTNTAAVTSQDILGDPDADQTNNESSASTIVHTPVLEVSKVASPATINAGEPITYKISYQNTGSGDAKGIVITDTLPANVYYSAALDTGTAGPKPTSVVKNAADGTTTLTWAIGDMGAASALATIEYKARPGLLFTGGQGVTNNVSLDFTDGNGNDYPAVTSSSSATITTVPPGKEPRTLGYWKNHPELWTAETLARIQATDQRFDGADGTAKDGILSTTEVQTVLNAGGTHEKVLKTQLLATYFNLATRQVNADTALKSNNLLASLSIANVKDAAVYAQNTLSVPANNSTKDRYSNAIAVLDGINSNKLEVYT